MSTLQKLPHVPHHVELWERYKSDPTNWKVRNELAEKYFGWLRHLAIYFQNRRSARHSTDELFNVGFLQMLKLMESFRVDGGANFVSYCQLAILRAMTQHTMGHVGPYIRHGKLKRARAMESHKFGRAVNHHEFSQSCGFSDVQLQADRRFIRFSWPESIQAPNALEKPCRSQDFRKSVELKELAQIAMSRLTPTERDLFERHHGDGVPMTELAKERGVSRQAIEQRLQRLMRHYVLPAVAAIRSD